MRLFCALFFSLLFIAPLFSQSEDTKHILVVNSYHRGFQWSDDVIRGIEASLREETSVELHTLYMDSKRIHSREYQKLLGQLYAMQLKNDRYDLIIAVDNFAYEFITEQYRHLFTDEPIIFVGLEQVDKERIAKLNLQDKVSGIFERRAIAENLELAIGLIPELKEIYIINDISKNGDDSEKFILEAVHNLSDRKIKTHYIRSSSREELLKLFANYDPTKAILFIRFYQDKQGRLYQNRSIGSMIEQFKIPVFVTDTLFIDQGALGGKLVLIEELGRATGKKALAILHGEISLPFFETFDSYDYEFSYPKIKEFGLSFLRISELSSGQKVFITQQPLSFFDRHRALINYLSLLFPVLLFFVLILLWDLTQRSKTEALLHQKIEFNDLLLRSVENPIFWKDSKGIFIDCNDKLSTLLGIPKERLKGRNVYDICGDLSAPVMEGLLTKALSEGTYQYDIDVINHQGEKLNFLVQSSEYRDKHDKPAGYVTILFDTTQKQKIKEEIERQRQFQIQQSKLAEIGEIFSSIAHQWKNPLVEVATIIQELNYKNQKQLLTQELLQTYTQETMNQITYMSETLNDFQDFIRPSKEKCSFDIIVIVKKLLELCRHNIQYNYIDVNLQISDSSIPHTIIGYPNEFMQVLLNLINNARDAILLARQKGRIQRGKITLLIKRWDGGVTIFVNDNAGGVSLEIINDIFSIYFTTKIGGHGIGLYMAKVIVEDKMGGKISVSNTEEGASFRIELYDQATSFRG